MADGHQMSKVNGDSECRMVFHWKDLGKALCQIPPSHRTADPVLWAGRARPGKPVFHVPEANLAQALSSGHFDLQHHCERDTKGPDPASKKMKWNSKRVYAVQSPDGWLVISTHPLDVWMLKTQSLFPSSWKKDVLGERKRHPEVWTRRSRRRDKPDTRQSVIGVRSIDADVKIIRQDLWAAAHRSANWGNIIRLCVYTRKSC